MFHFIVRHSSIFISALPLTLFACGSSTNSETGDKGSNMTGTGGSSVAQTTTSSSTSGTGGTSSVSSGGSEPGTTVRLIAIGDTGEGNTAQHCVADAMDAKCAQDGCDAVLLAGDNFYDDGVNSVDDAQWMDKFELPYDRPNLNGLPFYAVLGNHDYAPSPFDQIVNSDGVMQAQIDYSNLPVGTGAGKRYSDKWTMPASYYDVVLGDGLVHLFGVDSQDTLSDTQLDDMRMRVSTSTATWKIAFAHHPRYTSGNHQLDNGALNTLTSIIGPSMFEVLQGIYCDADIFLSGHDHNREYIAKGQDGNCPNTHFIISGAGAKTRDSSASAVSQSKYYDETIEGFFYLVFTGSEIRVESYDATEGDCANSGLATPAYNTAITP